MTWSWVCLAANLTCSSQWAHMTMDPASMRRVTARLPSGLVATDDWLMSEISGEDRQNLWNSDRSPAGNLDEGAAVGNCVAAGPGCFRRAPRPGFAAHAADVARRRPAPARSGRGQAYAGRRCDGAMWASPPPRRRAETRADSAR